VLKFQRIVLLFAPSILVCSISIHVIVEQSQGLNIWVTEKECEGMVKLKLGMEEQRLSHGKGILPESASTNSVSRVNSGCNCKVTKIYVVGAFCR